MKDEKEVIADFNRLVNMTADELEGWLKSDDSNSAGWPKNEGETDGETVGHDSGRRIVEILRANPGKKADEYTEEQVQHMRKVVAYCKRHLAQETAGNNQKSPEEVKKTKSYASLKNWGHDFLKAQGKDGSGANGKNPAASEEQGEQEDEEDGEDEVAGDGEKDGENGQAGKKRKKTAPQSGSNKKRETRKGAAAKKAKEQEPEEEEEEEEANDDDDEDLEEESANSEEGEEEAEDGEDNDEEEKAGGNKGGAANGEKAKNGPSKGETVSWNWGGGKPHGKVLDVKGEDTSITTHRGNEVSRHGEPDDPAVVIDAGKSKAIKKAHELNEY